jgi:TIR domain-containing protein
MTIFLSYAHEQHPIAEEVSVSLSVRGYDVFFDRSTLKPGVEYDLAIQKAVENCDLFVFLISPDSLTQGTYTLTELGFAKDKWKNPSGKILPVMVRSTLDSRVDAYLRAVTILYPQGNLAAEVAARAYALLEHKDVESRDIPPTGELQRERIATYRDLWNLTSLLPKWPRSRDVTYEGLHELSQDLRTGIFMKAAACSCHEAHTRLTLRCRIL